MAAMSTSVKSLDNARKLKNSALNTSFVAFLGIGRYTNVKQGLLTKSKGKIGVIQLVITNIPQN